MGRIRFAQKSRPLSIGKLSNACLLEILKRN